MFCPNCGTQNDDSLSTCQKCGFSLKGAAAPKFKGTMLMVNAPAAPKPAAPAPAPIMAPPAPNPMGHAQAMGQPPMGQPPMGQPQAGGKPVMKATMIGVAPPSAGGFSPGPAQAPTQGGFPPPQGYGQQPPPPAPMGPPPGGPQYGGGQYGAPHAMGGQAPMAGQPGEHVNPLAGTFVADPSAVAGYMGSQQAGQLPQQQPPQPLYGQPGPAPAPMGAPPAQQGWQGAPQGQAPMGAPPAQQGWQGAPQGGPAQAMGPGVHQGGYAPPGGAIQPVAGGGYPMGGPPGGGIGPGGTGPVGTVRNPVMVAVISCICGFYGLFALWQMLNELKAFRRKDDLNPIMFLVPIIQILEILKLPEKILDAKRMAGLPNPQVQSPILYLFLGIYFLPMDLNEIWQAVSARGGALPPAGR